MTFFDCNAPKCISMNYQECKIILMIYWNNCNNINDPYAKFCVPDVVKNMSRTN